MAARALFLMIAASTFCCAQPDQSIGVIGGFSVERRPYLELGIARAGVSKFGSCGGFGGYHGFALSTALSPGKNVTVMTQLTAWFDVPFLAAGINIAHYTDFHNNHLVFRPELGIGLVYARIVYGWNAPIPRSLPYVAAHQITLRVYVPVHSLDRYPEDAER